MLELRGYKYKEICEILSWKVATGKQKQLQLKELDRICKYHKEGNGKGQIIVIDEIYSTPLSKVDLRINNGGNNTSKYIGIDRAIAYSIMTNEAIENNIIFTISQLATMLGFRKSNDIFNEESYKLTIDKYNWCYYSDIPIINNELTTLFSNSEIKNIIRNNLNRSEILSYRDVIVVELIEGGYSYIYYDSDDYKWFKKKEQQIEKDLLSKKEYNTNSLWFKKQKRWLLTKELKAKRYYNAFDITLDKEVDITLDDYYAIRNKVNTLVYNRAIATIINRHNKAIEHRNNIKNNPLHVGIARLNEEETIRANKEYKIMIEELIGEFILL